ncbi:hypothetical protein [Streptomyces sp. NPDC048825]|uniref:hypothetical protein n=1 Tax=Streptomyces sp. NPDC048825 TaxID=3365592 RepID=UPI00371CD9C5
MPINQWDPAAQMGSAFHQQRRTDYMHYAYLQLGSDADAEETVDLTFDQVMDHWLRMLRIENLEGYAGRSSSGASSTCTASTGAARS